ncbi:hypothetical protein ACWOEJ_00360 [Enterococcus eurekensis]|uniref:ATPase V n=1 Tax=Enterococcus eurekensis TaxID=1159753 RepID=A0ABV9M3K1_9ENTE
MDAIDLIIEKINEQGANERNELKESRFAEIDTNFIVEQRKLVKEHEAQLAKQTEQVQKAHQQRSNRLTVEARQNALKKRQSYLERLFDEVHQQMVAWTVEETQTFVKGILTKLELKEVTILPAGKMNPSIFAQTWLEAVSQELAMTITLGATQTQADYGFLIEHEGVQYNFLYRDLLLEERKQKGRAVMESLFS